jgi:predicted metal-binding protein
LSANVVVCSGCCCGNLEKGHDEVPVDALIEAWEKNSLEDSVELTISGCLGPCNMRNVVLLETDQSQIWLGGLSSDSHYDAVVEWACDFSQRGNGCEMPEVLTSQTFTPKKSVKKRI